MVSIYQKFLFKPMIVEKEYFLAELSLKCNNTEMAIHHYKNGLRNKVILHIPVKREELEKLEEYYIEIIANLIKIAEGNSDLECALTEEYEKRALSEHNKRLESELLGIFEDVQEFLHIFDSHFQTLEMKAYLFKMKADFLRSKAKIFGIHNHENAVSLSISYYERAAFLLEKNSWLCPYKLDVHSNFTRLKTLLKDSEFLYNELSDRYEYAFLHSDEVQNEWKYFSEVLRNIESFLHKKDNIQGVTLEALVNNQCQSDFLLIMNKKEYLKSYYFF
ncbi:hypothetical protein TUBRATIS_007060 [Tubulinosema ratisbonensis]|uniref:Uncharacterized protein n=1 Tax=Tubulinosema ratisbonensis TaxID=291195 RepID=A0A437ANZ1_9MICR|nr:hypothetical protein TUBRATIS_007060 [Tubulinosema ratisbonensis]